MGTDLSASVGISLSPLDGTTPAELLARADSAMYRAKLEGETVSGFLRVQNVMIDPKGAEESLDPGKADAENGSSRAEASLKTKKTDKHDETAGRYLLASVPAREPIKPSTR